MVRFAQIVLNLPLDREFTYRIPGSLEGQVRKGTPVRVPFHGRRRSGVVVSIEENCDLPADRLLEIESCQPDLPPLPETLLAWTREMAEEYGCSWGTALEAALPGSLKRRNLRTVPGVEVAKDEDEIRLASEEMEEKFPKRARLLRALLDLGPPVPLQLLLRRTGLSRSPVSTLVRKGFLSWTRLLQEDDFLSESRLEVAPRHELVGAQKKAVRRMCESLERGEHRTFLLHGVTGSGKTEVYLRILEEVLARGRTAIILVPEISLTPQTVGRFLSRFPDIAVLHSSLSDATRARQWLRLAKGEARVVVGARSALFAPLENLGLIVVDEEHESSFKQQQAPRYHAREMAVARGRLEGALVVLGTATPSLEAWQRALTGEYERIELPERVGGGRLPRILPVDMRQEKPFRGQLPMVSKRLQILMSEKLRAGEQVLLFLNRRGFSPVLFCPACGETVKCGACEIPLAWHARKARLICHYCMEEKRRPELCPNCEASNPASLGYGTERVEAWVRRHFPEAVVARMDSDSMGRKDAHREVLHAFRRGDIDVLVGTQMIAKGLDFPRVTLVGVISADTGLFLPDFRAGERCFQLLAQVAGRAGRGEREGVVVLQTFCPEAPPVARALALDYTGFVEEELAARRRMGYPPFGRLCRLIFESRNRSLAERRAEKAGSLLRRLPPHEGLQVLGPAPCPLARLRGRFRFHLLLKSPAGRGLSRLRPELLRLAAGGGDRNLRVLLDVDAASML